MNDSDIPEKVDTFKADERGRINLGVDYADQEVRVAVLDAE